MEKAREHKGASLKSFPQNYTVIDIETTGLESSTCEIIEISAIRCRSFNATETFTTLIRPKRRISSFITGLTGITNDMVKNSPDINQAIRAFKKFAGSDILLGYNVNFDINFLYDKLMDCTGEPLTNDFVDVLRFARKALTELPDRRQTTVAEHYGISIQGAHRALTDCHICNACYLKLMDEPVFNIQKEGALFR